MINVEFAVACSCEYVRGNGRQFKTSFLLCWRTRANIENVACWTPTRCNKLLEFQWNDREIERNLFSMSNYKKTNLFRWVVWSNFWVCLFKNIYLIVGNWIYRLAMGNQTITSISFSAVKTIINGRRNCQLYIT